MDVFDLAAKISLNSQEYESGLSKVKQGLGTFAKVATASIGAAAAGIGAIVGKAVGEYGEYQQLVGGVNKIFMDSSSKVQQYAEQAYQKQGMSANQYMQTVTSFSASLMQGLGGDTEKAAKLADVAMTDMADNANTYGTSMDMIQNAYQGFAKQNFTIKLMSVA